MPRHRYGRVGERAERRDVGLQLRLARRDRRQLLVAVRSGAAVYAAPRGRGEPQAIKPGETPPTKIHAVRAPLPAQIPAGHVRVTVLRSGYCDTEGRMRTRGDELDLPKDIARRAIENSAVEESPAAGKSPGKQAPGAEALL